MTVTGFHPFPEIKTNRLLMRHLSINDAPEVLALRSTDNVMKYIDREKMKDIEESETYIKKVINDYENSEALLWVIALLNEPNKFIGSIGLWRFVKEHFRAEIGYTLLPAYWNKGIMYEALKAATSYGFEQMNLHSIEARINPDNKTSAALLEKTRFIREAYYKEDYFFKGEFKDTAVYSLLTHKNNVET